jgi:hypothetical protein
MGERGQCQVAAETEWMNFVGTFDESSLTSAGRSTTPLLDQTGVTFHIERTINGDIKDTFYLKDSDVSTEGKSSDQKLLKGSMLGRPIPPTAERQDVIKVLKTYFRTDSWAVHMAQPSAADIHQYQQSVGRWTA